MTTDEENILALCLMISFASFFTIYIYKKKTYISELDLPIPLMLGTFFLLVTGYLAYKIFYGHKGRISHQLPWLPMIGLAVGGVLALFLLGDAFYQIGRFCFGDKKYMKVQKLDKFSVDALPTEIYQAYKNLPQTKCLLSDKEFVEG